MKAYNYKCMEFENYKVFVHSQNVMCMELGGKVSMIKVSVTIWRGFLRKHLIMLLLM